ncbi:MAG: competence/damage-inducible protein A [Ignavibacteriaceae bacterium]|nr:MAG: Competence/damage-inducible protein CinA [Chlorobi bacterium OLB4]MBV6399400.1 Nicotinamide-nucleotide amidohydrolase PncC [Ignavibacteria bacterium]MBW7855753.1 competence/damage-inducible protein A [Ignavibacteria bacterium]MCC6886847.1 competence/damage-inducible protein A [Ignavibacteriales bacterium]MEB2330534.1 competence/damage-inducible protein A [Ignavibacteriaceae bacterium]
MPIAKVLSIGDELLIGQITNSNSAYIGSVLREIGIPVTRMVCVGDVEEDILNEFEDSIKNFDITIITGGLGPTHDDLTKPLLVKFYNDRLILNEDVLAQVESLFAKRQIPMPEINKHQAEVPSKCKVIPNKNGTAPGMWFEEHGKIVISLPGVPYEMKEMMSEIVIPMLKRKFNDKGLQFFRSKTLVTTGISESALYELIGDKSSLLKGGKLAYLPDATGVRLRIDVSGSDETLLERNLNILTENLKSELGIYYVGEDVRNEVVIGNLLRSLGKTISVAESCTGGMISEKIVSVAGSSDYYLGGVCAYSNESKVKILGVNEETIKSFGAVSEQTAKEMAIGCLKKFGTDFAISTTGIAGPTGGSDEKPIGLVWIGFVSEYDSFTKKFIFGNNRQRVIERATQNALNILRLKLLKNSPKN